MLTTTIIMLRISESISHSITNLGNLNVAISRQLISSETTDTVPLDEFSGEATPNRYEATVVVYKRPNNLAATEKAETPERALKGALSAAERQVRESRDKLRETWK